MKISSLKQVSFRRAILPASIIAAMAMSGSASAFKVDTGNDDLDVRWDNTFRYNAGWRAQDPTYYQVATTPSAAKWQSGDMVTNRLDILSEFDFIYKKDTGFRVSAAGWYDAIYNHQAPAGTEGTFGGRRYPDEIQRYYNGPSGEILDAFVFTKFDFGEVPVNVKLGQHTIYWGESIFSLADGVAAGQSYADLRKALATPGVEAKEVFKPLNQFSFSAQLSPELTMMGQYYFDWKPDLVPLGGTFFSPADFITYSGTTTVLPAGVLTAAPTGINWVGIAQYPKKKSGDWGLAARWRPEWLDGTAGFYYREYTPKNGAAFALNVGPVALGNPMMAGLTMDQDAPRTKLYGFSLAKQVFGISWGMDLTYRKDATLQAITYLPINSIPLGGTVGTSGWAPIGDIYTAVFNAIAYDGKRGIGDWNIYDSAVLTAEINYDGLDKITRNPLNWNSCEAYNSGRFAFGGPQLVGSGIRTAGGCLNGESYGLSFKFEPKWFQVWPGTDVTLPIFYTAGLKGQTVVPLLGSMEHAGAYSIGLTADVDAKYNFAVAYNGNIYKHVNDSLGHSANSPLGDFSHHDWVSFTAKATW